MPDPSDSIPSESERAAGSPAAGSLRRKWIVLAIAGVIATGVYVRFGDSLTLEELVRREDQLVRLRERHHLALLAGAFFLYVAVTALSLPGALVMTLLYGRFFGFGEALIVVSFASTAGATLAFLMSRYLFRDAIHRKFGDRLVRFNAALLREGAFYLFALRLTPAAPFFAINVVMGLTPIRTWTFWWVSQVGMLPGTCVFVLAGSRLPGPRAIVERGAAGILDWQLTTALVLLGLFPLAVRHIVSAIRKNT
jgi:uncharacterized membrane protein YdjX (TVP38/TMEM64 family)